MEPANASNGSFIPDLCRVRAVFLLLVTTELAAILFALVRARNDWMDWEFLGLASLFMQWIVLSSAGLICLLRPRLEGNLGSSLGALSVVALVVTLFTSLGFYWPGFSSAGSLVLILARNLLVALLVTGLVLRYFYLQHQWQAQRQASLRAQLASLQARMQPHFLFNSLNGIVSLIEIDPRRAEEALLDLAELIRASLRTDDQLITLERELQLCRQYLALEGLRLGDRLQVEWQLDPGANQQAIPPLTLQPLLENAIYHGIQPLAQGGRVSIHTEKRGERVYLLIRNPLPDEASSRHRGNRMALENTRVRLTTLFGETAVLKSSYQEGQYTVTLRLPFRPEPATRAGKAEESPAREVGAS